MNKEKENVCCIHLGIIACGDGGEHQHLACEESRVGILEIDNEHIKNYCLGTDHSNCTLFREGKRRQKLGGKG